MAWQKMGPKEPESGVGNKNQIKWPRTAARTNIYRRDASEQNPTRTSRLGSDRPTLQLIFSYVSDFPFDFPETSGKSNHGVPLSWKLHQREILLNQHSIKSTCHQ
jgi:hypothetical protein